MHNELNILTLEQRDELNMAVEYYKQATNESGSLYYMFDQMAQVQPTRRGGTNKVQVPRVDLEIGREAFSYWGPVFWNSFDNDLREKENKNTIKNIYLKQSMRDVNHPG